MRTHTTESQNRSLSTLAAPARLRLPLLIAGLALLLLFAGLLAICLGPYSIGLNTVCRLLASHILPLPETWSRTDRIVIETVRLPRILTAVIAGAGLSVSGAALQGILRNPLVGPQIIGISSACSFGGALAIMVSASASGIIACSFACGLLAIGLVFGMSRLAPTTTLSVVLTGVVIGSFFSALIGVLEYMADPMLKLPSIVFWLLGSFAAADTHRLAVIAASTLPAAGLLLALRWRINILSLNEADAHALGMGIHAVRWLVLFLVALVVAGQVSVSGSIGWVGLIIPHLARMLVGPDHRAMLPVSALLGGLYLLLVDTVARVATGQEFPLGILTAVIGTPAFGYLLWRTQAKGWSRS